MAMQTVRANGGHLVHLKDSFEEKALCGHQPAHTALCMKRRGFWWVTQQPVTCKKCMVLDTASKLWPFPK